MSGFVHATTWFNMNALRYICAGGAVLLSAAVASLYTIDAVSIPPASAEDGASHEIAQLPSAAVPVPSTRKVRVIDMSADNAVTSDRTRWHNRARKLPLQNNTARAEGARLTNEVRAIEKPKKKTARRAAPPTQDAYSAYASEPTPRRGGFKLFDW
jgi:hypothetical protein